MNQPDSNTELKIRPRLKAPLSLDIPADTLEALTKIAASRDMSVEGLLKLYVGQGLRQDLAKLFSERVLETTAQDLARRGQSEEEVARIIGEIRSAVGK